MLCVRNDSNTEGARRSRRQLRGKDAWDQANTHCKYLEDTFHVQQHPTDSPADYDIKPEELTSRKGKHDSRTK